MDDHSTQQVFELEKSVWDSDLSGNVKELFDELVNGVYDIPWNGVTYDEGHILIAACEEYHEKVKRHVTEHPVLAKAIARELLHWSLLTTAVEKLYREWSHPTIKFLIETNPSALLWKREDQEKTPLYAISNHHCHCKLMPWIAEQYPWILDHPDCQERPPSCGLVERYTRGDCTASTVRRFFEAFPRGLGQHDEEMEDKMPLHSIIAGDEECDADLFKWMAEQNPSSMSFQDYRDDTTLHRACMGLVMHSTDNMMEICNYLIEKRPELVRTKGSRDTLPIHLLFEKCNRRSVQQVVVLLLTEYPESYDMDTTGYWSAPNTSPFIQRLRPILEEECYLKTNIALLQEVSPKLAVATACSDDPVLTGLSDTFTSWSTTRIQVMEKRLQDIVEVQIKNLCDEFEEEDMEEEWDDDDDDYDDDGEEGGW